MGWGFGGLGLWVVRVVGYGLEGLGKFSDFSIVAWCINDNLEPLTLVDWFHGRKTSKTEAIFDQGCQNHVAQCPKRLQVIKISTHKVTKRHSHEK